MTKRGSAEEEVIVRAVRVLVFVALLLAPRALVAQQSTVTGVVLDTLTMPITGALVFIDDGEIFARSDSLGMFRLEGVTRAPHRLSYRGTGFAPRSFNLELLPDDETLDVGGVVLRPGPDPTATLTGVVTEQVGGQPLSGAVIEVNGRVVAETDSLGTFGLPTVPILWGQNVVRITHRAFTEAQTTDEFWIANPDETVDLTVSLDVAVLALPGVTVETAAPARSNRLEARGFYERMEDSSSGIFWTAIDIMERDPDDWDDLLRGVRFSRTRAATSFGLTMTGNCGRTALPLAFLDGAFVGDLTVLTESVRPENIEGLEIYRGVAGLPIEFNLLGAECGVVVVWTRGTF
ncbi:MAG: carboxypeptidase regulatory-like domain-containing protein [Longimicrobiales bacterium]